MNWTAITAIITLAALEAVALLKGINGATLSLIIAAIAGLGGFEVHKWTASRQQKKQSAKEEGAQQP